MVSYEKTIGVCYYFSCPFPLSGPDKFTERYNFEAAAFSPLRCSQFEIVVKEGILVWSSCGKKLEIFELSRATLD